MSQCHAELPLCLRLGLSVKGSVNTVNERDTHTVIFLAENVRWDTVSQGYNTERQE